MIINFIMINFIAAQIASCFGIITLFNVFQKRNVYFIFDII